MLRQITGTICHFIRLMRSNELNYDVIKSCVARLKIKHKTVKEMNVKKTQRAYKYISVNDYVFNV